MRIHSPYPASWALAQRIGYLYSEGEIIYLADTPFERLLDIQRQVGQCQTMTSLSQADFEARLEAVFHQNTGESQQIGRISINPSIFSRFRKRCPQMKIS